MTRSIFPLSLRIMSAPYSSISMASPSTLVLRVLTLTRCSRVHERLFHSRTMESYSPASRRSYRLSNSFRMRASSAGRSTSCPTSRLTEVTEFGTDERSPGETFASTPMPRRA